ncbi:aldehyde dehydrogenase family protein [Actinocorallia sp. A-T 12471]|uniref:aldehyde dehydrogenase family protein n=1 Tax=Actinocorallia sp. A-T 12471 TaxID=3089813 RepID=UPI0029D39897|nr:aldehyde dehydrogenase family protein [Actinocorallia sp. A-T 12471]MDX6743226.1 aldehyde dehydrogenase family protein [Actinocorallia sp. A-T 12471]
MSIPIAEQVARLRETFAADRTKPAAWRVRQLDALGRLLAEREDQISEALAADLGRDAFESWLTDLTSTRVELVDAKKNVRKWMRAKRVSTPLTLQPAKSWVQYEPLGVVLVISPWNYPFYLAVSPLIAALAAGNCVVVKPSEHAPATSALLAELLPAYLDADAVAVVEGAAEATQELIDQGLDHVLFTGGPGIAKAIMAGAAKHLTPVTLELGGKSPAIVTKDSDLAVAARRVAYGKYVNSGQTCIAPDYVLAERGVADAFAQEVVRAFDAMTEGKGGKARRIVNERHAQRLTGLLDGHGGKVVTGGESAPDDKVVDFTVVVDPDPDAPLMTEEIFGPILPIVRYDSLKDAIDFVRARPKPLAAYLFSPSKDDERAFLADVSAGGVVVNHVMFHVLNPHLPFGGVGNSGMGAYHGEFGFQTFSHRKAVLRKPQSPDPKLIYPPYTEGTRKLLRRFM